MGVLDDLESLILPASKLHDIGIPSASIAILEDGKISTHVITSGKENAETIYQAASISKAIAALALAKLVDQGRISYDTKVKDYLSRSTIDPLVDSKSAPLMDQVTFAMLAAHTAGLSQIGFPGYPGPPPAVEDILAGRPTANTPRVRFASFPGQQWSYSGGGYTVLQLALEKVTGLSFPQLMQEIVLEPLNMTRSHYGELSAGEENYTNAYLTAHYMSEQGYNILPELAAAGLWTTPTDLLKAVSAVQDSLYTDNGFLTQRTARTMLIQQAGEDSMSIGWMVSDYTFGHTGGNEPGFNTVFYGCHDGVDESESTTTPSSNGRGCRNGISIMTNSRVGHSVAINHIVSALVYLKGWPRERSLPETGEDDDFSPYAAPAGAPVQDGWQKWIGDWEQGLRIVDEDGPAIVSGSLPAMRLLPAAAPARELEEGGKEPMFVVDGLRFGMRFTCEDGMRVIKLLQDEPKTLKRM